MLDIHSQINKVIDDASSILVMFPFDRGHLYPHGDALASALALACMLTTMKKQVEVVAADFVPINELDFLPGYNAVRGAPSAHKETIIKINIAESGLQSIRYETKNDELRVRITPARNSINAEHVAAAHGRSPYDATVIIGAPDLASLKSLAKDHAHLFTEVPVINIDHNPANERFGHINLVEVTAAANAEVVHDLLGGQTSLPPEVATALLTGLIIKTKSFKTPNVNARTLARAAALMKAGADREMIVRKLYRSRTLATLKLWGLALSKLQHDPQRELVTVSLTREDFVESGATEESLPDVIDEIFAYAPEIKLILLLHESLADPQTIHAHLHAEAPYDARLILKNFEASGAAHDARVIFTAADLVQVRAEIAKAITGV